MPRECFQKLQSYSCEEHLTSGFIFSQKSSLEKQNRTNKQKSGKLVFKKNETEQNKTYKNQPTNQTPQYNFFGCGTLVPSRGMFGNYTHVFQRITFTYKVIDFIAIFSYTYLIIHHSHSFPPPLSLTPRSLTSIPTLGRSILLPRQSHGFVFFTSRGTDRSRLKTMWDTQLKTRAHKSLDSERERSII